MADRDETRRARWKRNKRDQREREKQIARPSNPEFEHRVWAERDRRIAAAYRGAWCWPESRYLSGERLARAVEFAADVWAADVLLTAQWEGKKPSVALVCAALKRDGRTHGYTDGSLRKLIPKARERARLLERSAEPWTPYDVFWRPFGTSEDSRKPPVLL